MEVSRFNFKKRMIGNNVMTEINGWKLEVLRFNLEKRMTGDKVMMEIDGWRSQEKSNG